MDDVELLVMTFYEFSDRHKQEQEQLQDEDEDHTPNNNGDKKKNLGGQNKEEKKSAMP
jgi:hypothetical protein